MTHLTFLSCHYLKERWAVIIGTPIDIDIYRSDFPDDITAKYTFFSLYGNTISIGTDN